MWHAALSVAHRRPTRPSHQSHAPRLRHSRPRRRLQPSRRSAAVAGLSVVGVPVYRTALRRREGESQPPRDVHLWRRLARDQARLYVHQQPAGGQRGRSRGVELASTVHHSISRSDHNRHVALSFLVILGPWIDCTVDHPSPLSSVIR